MQRIRFDGVTRVVCIGVAAIWCAAAAAQGQKPSTEALPGSRDELFGTKPATAAPASDKPVSLSGFYDFLGAYTYSDPSHWSNAVNRFQLSAQGRVGENVKWTIGGRVDADIVYATSDFYLSDVRNDQKLNAFWRENVRRLLGRQLGLPRRRTEHRVG